MAKQTDPDPLVGWRWTEPIRDEIVETARKLRERKKHASGEELEAIELKLHLLEDCFKQLGNVIWY
jgi:hypothetical protein